MRNTQNVSYDRSDTLHDLSIYMRSLYYCREKTVNIFCRRHFPIRYVVYSESYIDTNFSLLVIYYAFTQLHHTFHIHNQLSDF